MLDAAGYFYLFKEIGVRVEPNLKESMTYLKNHVLLQKAFEFVGEKMKKFRLISYVALCFLLGRPAGAMLSRSPLKDRSDLLKKSVHDRDPYGRTPLHVAAELGYADICSALLGKGADSTAKNMFGQTPFRMVEKEGHIDVWMTFIKKGAVERDVTDKNGATLLILAARNGRADMCLALIEMGADVHAKNRFGATPLTCAAQKGLIDVCRALIKRGADVLAGSPLKYAVQEGHADVCRVLIDNGAAILFIDTYGSTLLKLAADNGHADVCSTLIEKGLDVHNEKRFGSTPLYVAASQGHVDACIALINSGADIHAGQPLSCAAKRGHAAVCIALIEGGANIHEQNLSGFTPLYWAARKGLTPVCFALIERATRDFVEDTGRTLLFDVAKKDVSIYQKVISCLTLLGRSPESMEGVREKWRIFLMSLNRMKMRLPNDVLLMIIVRASALESDYLQIFADAFLKSKKLPSGAVSMLRSYFVQHKERLMHLIPLFKKFASSPEMRDVEEFNEQIEKDLHKVYSKLSYSPTALLAGIVEKLDDGGMMLLQEAACQGDKETMCLLLLKGARLYDSPLNCSPNSEEVQGIVPVYCAIQSGYEKVALYLLTLLLQEVVESPIEAFCIRSALNKRYDDKNNGKRLLHFAAEQGYAETMKLLIKLGVCVTHQDNAGGTAAYYLSEAYNAGLIDFETQVEISNLLQQTAQLQVANEKETEATSKVHEDASDESYSTSENERVEVVDDELGVKHGDSHIRVEEFEDGEVSYSQNEEAVASLHRLVAAYDRPEPCPQVEVSDTSSFCVLL